MLRELLSTCVLLSLVCSGAPLSCRWLQHKFKHHSHVLVDLLDTMNTTIDETTMKTIDVPFPYDLYSQAARASAENKISFAVQILLEVSDLLEENSNSSSPEHQNTVDDFLSVLDRQADELQSCIGSHRWRKRKLQLHFKKFSDAIEQTDGESAETWETIRKEVRAHLLRVDLLLSSLLVFS